MYFRPAAQRISIVLTELVVLDTVPPTEESAMTGKITQLSVGPSWHRLSTICTTKKAYPHYLNNRREASRIFFL